MGWKKTASFKHFDKAANVGLIIAGGLLLLMQLHGYQHTQYPDEYPLNKDDHSHVHKDMEAAKKPLSLQDYGKKIELKPTAHDHGDGNLHTH